jgi:hypothetical protein
VLNQIILTVVAAGVALVMLVKAQSDDGHLTFSRRLIRTYFLRVAIGWFCILGASAAVSVPLNFAFQLFSSAIRATSLEWSVSVASTLIFALIQAAIAAAFFQRLPDTLREVVREPVRGERQSLFFIYAILFATTGAAFWLAWYWWPDMAYATNTRLADAKIAVDSFLVSLLVFAARRQNVLSDPAITSAFD